MVDSIWCICVLDVYELPVMLFDEVYTIRIFTLFVVVDLEIYG